MPIDFSRDRWETVRDNYRRWWAGELDRPLIHMQVSGRDPGRPEPKLPMRGFTSFYDLDVPAEAIVDRWDWELSRYEFLGDAFPSIWPNFGAGVLAAILGARLYHSEEADTTWFGLPDESGGLGESAGGASNGADVGANAAHAGAIAPEIADISFRWDPDNVWLRRISDLMQAAMDRWDGLVQISMTDLGGNLDVLSTFRPSEKLLLDLYDAPDEVKRLTDEEHEMWWRAFDHFNAILQPRNPGYTAWTPILSEVPYYMLQCDFCYMISPEMFDEFVKPELAASCRRLGNPFYHLDGPGQLPHLDSLLAIPELKGVQWVPGTGNAEFDEWPEVYRKIRAAGKLAQVWTGEAVNGPWRFDVLVDQLGGDPKGLIGFGNTGQDDRKAAVDFLKRYDAM